jgi:hypothetical protein
MEVGSWYALCRIMENVSRLQNDRSTERRARSAAESIARHFTARFWDEEAGFFRDSVETEGSRGGEFHPLFSLLFLQSSLGLSLVRPHIASAAKFVARELLTDSGLRVLPLRETRSAGEAVLDSWYPHWDLYALKLLRRAGEGQSILRWMGIAEEALAVLGYCPEFLAMKGFREKSCDAWLQHGSASNLNCVSSWFRALRESVAGFEFDPGGVTHVPLSLPIPSVRIEDVSFRGGRWTFESFYDGPFFESLTVDGRVLEGCLKIPASAYTGGEHHVTVHYGHSPRRACFTEVANATVLRSRCVNQFVEIDVYPLGHVEVVFYSPEVPRLSLDGQDREASWDKDTRTGSFEFTSQGLRTIRLYCPTQHR